jgi:hypothetical protein
MKPYLSVEQIAKDHRATLDHVTVRKALFDGWFSIEDATAYLSLIDAPKIGLPGQGRRIRLNNKYISAWLDANKDKNEYTS